MPARFIDLEGIDQAGKETQAWLLLRKLRGKGLKVDMFDFPIYSTRAGLEIRAFLDGRRRFSPEVVHLLYSLNRWENRERLLRALDESDVLLTDRYAASNLAYGLAKGLDEEWLVNLDRGLPVPWRVVVLDVPVGFSFDRKRRGRDVHERDRGLLGRVRRNYLKLAGKYGWSVVDAARPAETVHAEVLRRIRWKGFGSSTT